MSTIQTAERVVASPRRASRPLVEPAPEHGPFAERVTYPADGVWLHEDRVVICLNQQREFRSESLIMRLLRRDRTPLRTPEEIYAPYAALFVARRDAR